MTLGIESYSSTYAFLYIGYHEVRNEILVPLASLAAAAGIQFNNRDPNFLEIDEQDACKDAIAAYFTSGNPLEIDGIRVKPVVDRIDFYGLEVRDFVTQAARRRVSMASGRVGLILRYSTKGAPRRVQLTWDRFSATMTNVETVVFPFQDAARFKFARYLPENTYVWENPGTPPLPSLTAIEGPEPQSVDGRPAVGLAIAAALSLLVSLFAAVTARRLWAIAALLAATATRRTRWTVLAPPRPRGSGCRGCDLPATAQKHLSRVRLPERGRRVRRLGRERRWDAAHRTLPADPRAIADARSRRRRVTHRRSQFSRRIDRPDGDEEAEAGLWLSLPLESRRIHRALGTHSPTQHRIRSDLRRPAPGTRWKITAMEIVDELPPKIKTSVRRLERSPTQP